MAQHDEFAFMDATQQADLVRNKEVLPLELVDSAIDRIEQLNPKINAVITSTFEMARGIAKQPDKLPNGKFKGVPFLLKDILAEMEGVRRTSGTNYLDDFVSPRDSELVKRYKKSGLIILGKTNVPELGILATTEPKRFGPTRNPWDLSRTPGGSSGGSAAAVACGMVSMAHGNDGAGSIRIPSSCCGLFGMKPTRGRITLAPMFGDLLFGLVSEHAITRSVRDSAALMDATAGSAPGDPYYAPPPKASFLKAVGRDPGNLKIGVITYSPSGMPIDDDCLQALDASTRLCKELGHTVEEAKFDTFDVSILAHLPVAFDTVYSSGVAWQITAMEYIVGKKAKQSHFEPLTWAYGEKGELKKSVDLMNALFIFQRFSREIGKLFAESYDILLSPTLALIPPKLGSFDAVKENPLYGLEFSGIFSPFTVIANITGQPAMSVPLYWNEEGLPIGTHFIGSYGDEETLFSLAAQLEEVRPWKNFKPEVVETKK
ncbi:MAG: amidase [Desulfobacterales bacterium]|nr:amidase [Desulfobacterales bacterium]